MQAAETGDIFNHLSQLCVTRRRLFPTALPEKCLRRFVSRPESANCANGIIQCNVYKVTRLHNINLIDFDLSVYVQS